MKYIAFLMILLAPLPLWAHGDHEHEDETPMESFAASSVGSDFVLKNSHEKNVDSEKLKDKPWLLFFGYTNCPDVCPTTLNMVSLWMKALKKDADKLHVIFVASDPARDTPAVLKAYMKSFDPHIIALTGSEKAVTKMAASYHIFIKKVPMKNGDYAVDHTSSVLLIDKDGTLQGAVNYQDSEAFAVAKIRKLLLP